MKNINSFNPDYVIHPGEILEETLDARGITKVDFAKRCGITTKTVSQIIGGKAPVSSDMSIQFGRVLGVSAVVWNNLNAAWELGISQQKAKKRLMSLQKWADLFPWREMIKIGWIEKTQEKTGVVDELLAFFGVASADAWQTGFNDLEVAYRKSTSFESNPYAVAVWLRRGEQLAETIDTKDYDAQSFQAVLQKTRKLTVKSPDNFEEKLKSLCAESGVALVFEGELKGTRLSGAARWLTKDKALIQLSLRHKTDDHFWFSFFHEAAHILKHGKRQLYLDDTKSGNTDLEYEANEFAAEILISSRQYQEFCDETSSFTENKIKQFARKTGIAPGIVLGRLQHDERVSYNSVLNKSMKKHFELRKS